MIQLLWGEENLLRGRKITNTDHCLFGLSVCASVAHSFQDDALKIWWDWGWIQWGKFSKLYLNLSHSVYMFTCKWCSFHYHIDNKNLEEKFCSMCEVSDNISFHMWKNTNSSLKEMMFQSWIMIDFAKTENNLNIGIYWLSTVPLD